MATANTTHDSTAEADTVAVTCHMAGCDRVCHRDLTRTVVLDATETGVPTETEERLVCARHYYAEAAVRESMFWIGFAIFVLLMAPSITGWGWWWT